MKLNIIAAGVMAASMLATSAAFADPVTSTLTATFFQVLNGTGGPDFGGSGTPVVALGSGLGPNGLPIVTGGVSDIGPSNQLTWWSPALNTAVIPTGTGSITLPFSGNMFPTNSNGTSDSAAFETAIFLGTFNGGTGRASVNFTVGSDDDSFVYLNGVLIGQNPGIHGVTNVQFNGTDIAGTNTLEIFYADREGPGAFLSVDASVPLTGVSAVPETSTWAMMILGFCGVGFMAYRRKSKPALMVA
jgi:hypothetical protein